MGKVMFSFTMPWAFLLLLLPIIFRLVMSGAKPQVLFEPPVLKHHLLSRLRTSFGGAVGKKSSNWWNMMWLGILWLSLVTALANPQLISEWSNSKSKAHDIIMAVDLSDSMRALDFSTNSDMVSRLDITKKVVSNFIKGRMGDRIGLVVFGSKAYIYSPLTYDLSSVNEMVNNTVTSMAGNSTAIGDAISVAVKNIRGGNNNARIIILLTDGENNDGVVPPITAAEIAKKNDVKIYTIGMGKGKGEVPIPHPVTGHIIMATAAFDEALLKRIAAITGGSYFHAGDEMGLQEIYAQIDAMEKIDIDVQNYAIRKHLYHWPLLLALLALMAIITTPVLAAVGRRI
jgi:Ca-activated chloride channel family protein